MATNNPPLEFLTTTRIGEKGQLTVPKQFREELGLGIGAPFAVLRLGDGLILLPEQQRFEELCQRIASKLMSTRQMSTRQTQAEILMTLPEARDRVYARHYGKRGKLVRRARADQGR
jgi:AbrB family looped-hinge helix DNA binding protein